MSYEGTARIGPAEPRFELTAERVLAKRRRDAVIQPRKPYGLGVILGVENNAVLVDFRPQHRRIPLPCAKLTKL